MRHAENTAEAFHSKNERPFANGSISAKKPDAISKDVVLLRADLFIYLSRVTLPR